MSDEATGGTANRDWVLAFDCGTTSLKAAVIGSAGAIRSEASAGYRLYQGENGLVEQDGDEIWAAVVAAGTEALASAAIDAGDVCAVVFAGTWKALLPLDGDGVPLCRAAIWIDSRGREYAKRLNVALGRYVGTGQEYWPRAMRLKEEQPEVWNAASSIVGINTYLKFKATGVLANEPSDDFVHGVDAASRAEFDEILRAAGLYEDRGKFVEPRPAESLVGTLTPAAAQDLGLPEQTPVFNGYGDLPAIMVGTGTGRPGRAHIYLGSSSWFVLATSTPPTDVPLTFTVSADLYGAAYVIQSGCLAYDWAVAQLYRHEREELGKHVNAVVNRDVAEVEAGSANLLATHWINGELPPLSKNSRGLFLNLTSLHDRRHMVRAIMESICYAHRAHYEDYLAKGGSPLDHVRVVGGGATSDVWMQILADVLGVPVEVPVNPQCTGTLGVFYAAQVGLGRLASFADIEQTVLTERRFEPNPAVDETYSRLYGVHRQLHGALRGIFSELNGDY